MFWFSIFRWPNLCVRSVDLIRLRLSCSPSGAGTVQYKEGLMGN